VTTLTSDFVNRHHHHLSIRATGALFIARPPHDCAADAGFMRAQRKEAPIARS
jgi:hypothetical protein